MQQINRISIESTDRINASQVIQSLSSCVRELVENSLDAKASSVSVRLRSRGNEIEVADNGLGIAECDWGNVCAPHSTSKIVAMDDLNSRSFKTHGFRGEALASICFLASKLRMVTRTTDMGSGTVLLYDRQGTLLQSGEQVSKSIGTTVTVYGLFLESLPVRHTESVNNFRKEVKILQHLLTELSICHFNINFELLVDGKSQLSSAGGTNAYQVFQRLIGGEAMIEIGEGVPERGLRVFGWISKQGNNSSKQSSHFFFVNERPHQVPKSVIKAIVSTTANPKPDSIIFLDVPNDDNLDINISVDKRAILIASEFEETLTNAIIRAISKAYQNESNREIHALPKVEFRSSTLKRSDPEEVKPHYVKRTYVNDPQDRAGQEAIPIERPSPEFEVSVSPKKEVATPDVESVTHTIISKEAALCRTDADCVPPVIPFSFSKDMFMHMDIVGQFNNGFIVTRLQTLEPHLFLVDQHAANEKFLFEHYYRNIKINIQPLLCPKQLKLSPTLEETIMAHATELEQNGFRIFVNERETPGRRVSVHTVPTLSGIGFNRSAALTTEDLIEIVNSISGEEIAPTHDALRLLKFLKSVFASKACRTAVMVGDTLSDVRMLEIVRSLSSLDSPWNCPHGRPTLKHLVSIDQLVGLGYILDSFACTLRKKKVMFSWLKTRSESAPTEFDSVSVKPVDRSLSMLVLLLSDYHVIDPIIEEQEMRFSSETPPPLTESPSARSEVQEKTIWGFVSYLIRGEELGVSKTGLIVEPSHIIMAESKLDGSSDDSPITRMEGTVEVPKTVLNESDLLEQQHHARLNTEVDDIVQPSQAVLQIQQGIQVSNPESSLSASADSAHLSSDWVSVSEGLSMDQPSLEVSFFVPDSSRDVTTKLPLDDEAANHLSPEGVDMGSEMQRDAPNESDELHDPSIAEESSEAGNGLVTVAVEMDSEMQRNASNESDELHVPSIAEWLGADNQFTVEGMDNDSAMQRDASNERDGLQVPSIAESSGTITFPDIDADASASITFPDVYADTSAREKTPTADDRGTGRSQELFASAFSALSFPESIESSEERSDGSITLKQEEEVQNIETKRVEMGDASPEAPGRCTLCGRRGVIARSRCLSI